MKSIVPMQSGPVMYHVTVSPISGNTCLWPKTTKDSIQFLHKMLVLSDSLQIGSLVFLHCICIFLPVLQLIVAVRLIHRLKVSSNLTTEMKTMWYRNRRSSIVSSLP